MQQEITHEIIDLYQSWLTAWNNRSAEDMAALFAEEGNIIGFDGSQMHGRKDLKETLGLIFQHHATASYIAIIKEIRFFTENVAWLKADVGMVPANGTDINPALNAVQTMIAIKPGDEWQITIFQNTPAAFHAAPELAVKMTEELREVLSRNN